MNNLHNKLNFGDKDKFAINTASKTNIHISQNPEIAEMLFFSLNIADSIDDYKVLILGMI